MSVGENIRRIREEKKMSQEALAERAGVTQAMISHIEKGIRIPSFLVAVEIAKALECKTEEFLAEGQKTRNMKR